MLDGCCSLQEKTIFNFNSINICLFSEHQSIPIDKNAIGIRHRRVFRTIEGRCHSVDGALVSNIALHIITMYSFIGNKNQRNDKTHLRLQGIM